MKFNINENVKVRLTDYGREILKKDHEEFWFFINKSHPYIPPVEDADGWSTWQMWCLMRDLGKHISMSGPNPFELTIEIGE